MIIIDSVEFVRLTILADAGMDGHEYAMDARLPRIPDRWASSPELRESWITGYLTELRNRLEHP
jgi:hypothetical protein